MSDNDKKPVKKVTITEAATQSDSVTPTPTDGPKSKVNKITVIHDDDVEPQIPEKIEESKLPKSSTETSESEPATAPLLPDTETPEPKKSISITIKHDETSDESIEVKDEDTSKVIESINAELEQELESGMAESELPPAVEDESEALDVLTDKATDDSESEPIESGVDTSENPIEPEENDDIEDAPLEAVLDNTEESGTLDPKPAQSQLVKAALNNNLQTAPTEATVPVQNDVKPAVSDAKPTPSPEAKPAMSAPLPPQPRKKRGFKAFFAALRHSKTARWATFGTVMAVLLAAGALPSTRYYALNLAGVRSGASVQVIDESTLQPLKNVEVKIADQSVQTDEDGRAQLHNLKLGSTQLIIQKRAFAPINKPITVGWGSNPLGGFNLTPVGSQYSFSVVDYLSGKPLAKVQAMAGDANAQSDDKGAIKLTLDHENSQQSVDVKVTAEGYRNETLKLDLNGKQAISLKLVASGREVFLSKRTGTYDVYAVDVDGKNEKLILPGTGRERDSLMLVPSHDGNAAALISTRDEVRNADGFLKSTLTIIDVADGAHKSVIQSEQMGVVGWTGTRLVYIQVAAGTSAGNPSRVKLMSYDYNTGDNHQLASTNYFNDVLLVNGKIYYAPSSTYQGPGVAVDFFSINPDGSNKQTVLGEETWNAFRTGYDSVLLSVVDQKWYSYALSGAPTKLEGAPGNIKSRVYVDSPDGKRSLWVDERDGKGVLLSYDIASKTDKVLQSRSGLTLPLRWLNNSSVVYRVINGQETADYAISLNGGEPHKITDVTNTNNVDGWYYY